MIRPDRPAEFNETALEPLQTVDHLQFKTHSQLDSDGGDLICNNWELPTIHLQLARLDILKII